MSCDCLADLRHLPESVDSLDHVARSASRSDIALQVRQSLMSAEFFARNSRAGNGSAISMGTWDFLVLSGKFLQEPLHAHKILRFGGRGGIFIFLLGEGGGKRQLYFNGHGDFSEFYLWPKMRSLPGNQDPNLTFFSLRFRTSLFFLLFLLR